MVLAKDRHTDQWNGIESLEIDPHIYGKLPFEKSTKEFNGGEDNLSINCVGIIIYLCRKEEL